MEIYHVLKHALEITFFVLVMMLMVDFIDSASNQRMSEIIKGGYWRQYTLASLLGSTPGCLGAFMSVSLYVHGIISFGAIVGSMIATSGDEAFVMLVQFPATGLVLFLLLFIAGILFAWISDKIVSVLRFTPCEACSDGHCEQCLSELEQSGDAKRIFRVQNLVNNYRLMTFTRFLFLALILSFLVSVSIGILGPAIWDWKRTTFIALSLCALYIGMAVPESGPHLVFVMLYAEGLVPFSVLLTTSFVQDGHGMLPLLSYSLKDSLLIKLLNLIFGLSIGSILLALGI